MPDWLANARNSVERSDSSWSTTDVADVCAGDLWVVGDGTTAGLRRIVLIANAQGCELDVVLTSNEIEWASDSDVIVQPDDSGAPYALMIQTLLTAKIHWGNAVARIGAIDDALLDDVLDFIWDERPASLDDRRGRAARDVTDPDLIDFQRSEATALAALAASRPVERRVVDRSVLTAMTSPRMCLGVFRALSDDMTIATSGLADHLAIVNDEAAGVGVADMFGADVAWRLHELFALRLLNGDAADLVALAVSVSSCHGRDDVVASSAVPLHGGVGMLECGADVDGPIASIGAVPVFSCRADGRASRER